MFRDIKNWCKVNCKGPWRTQDSNFYFIFETDAFDFKMNFGDYVTKTEYCGTSDEIVELYEDKRKELDKLISDYKANRLSS